MSCGVQICFSYTQRMYLKDLNTSDDNLEHSEQLWKITPKVAERPTTSSTKIIPPLKLFVFPQKIRWGVIILCLFSLFSLNFWYIFMFSNLIIFSINLFFMHLLLSKWFNNFPNTKVPERKILRRYGKSNDTLGSRNDLKLLTLMVLRSLPVSKVPKTIQMSNFRRFCVPSVSFDFLYLFKIFRYGTFKFKKCFSNLEVQYRKI